MISPQDRTDVANFLAFDGLLLGIGKRWPAVGLTIGISKVISITDAYKEGMIGGRKNVIINENDYPVNHSIILKTDSGIYCEYEACFLKFR